MILQSAEALITILIKKIEWYLVIYYIDDSKCRSILIMLQYL